MVKARAAARSQSLTRAFAPHARDENNLQLGDGSRVAIVGGGPSGSFFSYFLLRMAKSLGLDVRVDIYEPRFFGHSGPAGCNHCGGIVSESLVQHLATEGINIPPTVVQRAIDSYVLHMDVGTVRIDTPLHEKRIAAVFRGGGPRGAPSESESLDRHLLGLAESEGARVVREMVCDVEWPEGRPHLEHRDGSGDTYDLLVLAAGVNSRFLDRVAPKAAGYRTPKTVTTYICEFVLDRETIQRTLGTSMHVYLLDLPRLEFAAFIPKGNVVTMCLLGDDIDQELVAAFLESPEVRSSVPPGIELPARVCHCSPLINVGGVSRPFADRMVALGDSGVTRLYKDGIGAAYRTAKAAAVTAAFHGISAADFARHYGPTCRRIARDNAIGKFVFGVNRLLQRTSISRSAILRMTEAEQQQRARPPHMSQVLWDLFTGSAPYGEILKNTMRPGFLASLGWNLGLALADAPRTRRPGPAGGRA